MDDKFQDVRVPGNSGSSDTAQQSASVSFGQVIPTSVPNLAVAQPLPVSNQPVSAPTPLSAPTPAQPIIAAAPTPVQPLQSSSATQPGFTQAPVTPPVVKPLAPRGPKRNFNWKKIAKYGGIAAVALLIVGGISAVAMNFLGKKDEGQVLTSSRFNTVQIPLDDLGTEGDVSLLGTRSLLVNGPLRANSAFIISPSAQPSNAARGQIYYDQGTNQMSYFNGSKFVPISDTSSVVQNIGGFSGTITLGQGLSGANGQITNNGVLTVQGQTGNVTFVGGPGIAVDGTTITNSGVTSFGGRTGDVTVGSGLTITPAGELQNSGVVSAAGGAGINVVNDGNGNITISNTGAGTGTVQSSGGTTGRIAKFTGVQTIEDSLLSETGATVTVNGDLSVTGSLALSTALTVGNGGTGATALAANGVVIGQGSGALTAVTAGGSGLCFMSTGGAPAFQACPGGASVLSVNGLTGALNVANATGSGTTITLNDASTAQKGIAQFNATNFTAASGIINTIQDIAVTSTPTFGRLTVTSSQATNPMLLVNNTNGGATGNLVDIQLNGASRLALTPAGNMTVSGTINGQTISSAASFTGSLAVATNITASGDVAVNGGDVTSTGALNITPGGALTVGTAAQSLTLQGNGSTTLTATNAGSTTTVSFQTPTANVNYRLLTAAAGTYDICTTAGNCVGVGGSVSTPGGTTNQLAKFTGSNTIGNSIISDNGATVSIAGALAVNTITPSGPLTIGAIAQNLTLQGASTSLTATSGGVTNTLTFATPSGGNKTITVPNATGTIAVSASGPLALDAAGNLTCATCLTSGSAVTSLNGLTGALSIANATGVGSTITIQDASTAQKGIAQFNSTNFSAASGSINTIQNINVTATPTFGALTLTSSQATSPMLLVNNTNISGTGNLIDLQLNSTSRLAVTPAGNMTLTGTLNGQTISSAANLTGTLAVAGAANLNGGATVTGTLTANTITPTGAMTVGATGQSLSLQGNASSTFSATNGASTTSLSFQSPTANVTYRLLTAAAGAYDICTSVGNCAGVGGGVTSPGGTTNQLAKFSAANTIVDSIISDNGTTVSVGGVLAVNTITPTGALTIGATGQNLLLQGATTSLTATNGGITNNLTFATPSGSNKTITVPNATGTIAVSASGPITLDAAGNIACPTCALTGSGVTSLNGLTGALSIANASGVGSTITIQDASTSQKGIAQFNSTNFSAASGTINTIQDIAVASAPTFGRLTLTSSQASNGMLLVNNTNAGATGNLLDVQLNGTSRLAVTPAGNMTLTGTVNGQTVSSAANLTGTLAVAGLASLNGGATVTGTLTANTITPSGALTVGATTQSFLVQGSASSTITATSGANTTTVSFQTPTANVTYRLLTAAAGTYDICTTVGNCSGVGGGVTTPGGTTGAIAKFSGSGTIVDSIITESGSTITVGGTLAVNTITPAAAMTIGSTSQDLTLQGADTTISETDGGITNSLVFATPSGSNKTITLPNATGTVAVSASGPLAIDAAGNITCATCVTSGGGGGGVGAVDSLNGLTGALTLANATGVGTTVTIDDASTSQKGIAQFNSTNFSASVGVINTIQNINTTAAPTFGQLTLSSSQASAAMLTVNNTNVAATGNLIDIQLNGTSRLAVTPAGNMTVTGTVNGQTISSTASLTGTLAVAGAANLNGGATVTGTLTANTISPTGALTVGITTQNFTLQGAAASTITATNAGSTTSLAFQTPTANVTYRLLTAAAGTYDICTTVGNCAGVGGGVTTAGGTTGRIAKFTGSNAIGDSLLSESGSIVTVTGTLAATTALQTPLLDTASAGTLNIGTTNATAINLNQDTTVAGSLDVTGGFLTVGAFQVAQTGDIVTGGDVDVQGGALNLGTTTQAGTITLSDASSNTVLLQTAALGANRTVTFADEAGTVCIQSSTACGFAPTSGSANYIQNQNSIDQTTANFRISGTGRANTSFLAPLLDTAAAGTLTLGGTATAIALNENTTVTGNLNQSTGTFSLASNGTGSVTSNGSLTLTAGGGSTWSTSSGNLTVSAAGTSTLALQTGGAGLVALGDQNTTTINIGRGSNIARTITIGDTSGGNQAQTVTVGNTGASSVTTIKGGGGVTINAVSGNWSLQGASTSTLAGTSGSFTTTLGFTTPTANTTLNLPALTAGTYTVCTSSGNCAGAGVTLQSAYNNSTNPELTLDATRGALTIRDASSALGANLLEVQNNAGGTTYFAVSATGTSTTGTATATGNINSSGGTLQTNSVDRVDNTGNLVNIGNITGTGAMTIASSGAGNDIVINGADILDIQDATTFATTAVFNGVATFNTDVDMNLADTENLELTNTVTGTNALTLNYIGVTNNTTGGTQRGQLIQNIGGSGLTDQLLVLDNADVDTAVTTALQISSAAGTIQTAVDLTDAEIVTALSVADNTIAGTTANLDFTNFDVTGATGNIVTAGDIAVNGGDITSAGDLLLTAGGLNLDFNSVFGFTFKNGATDIMQIDGQNGRLDLNLQGSFGYFKVNTTGGTSSLFADDTSVQIGYDSDNDGHLLILDTKLNAGDPSGTDGSMYYNATAAKFRCYENGAWKDCITTSGAVTLQGAYNGGNTIAATDARDIAITMADTATDSNFLINLECDTSCSTNGRFAIQDDAVDVFRISPAGGAALFQNSANSTAAFNVKTAAGGNLFTVDSTNSRVGINLGANNTPVISNAGLQVQGAIRISGTGDLDSYATPVGANVAAKFSIQNMDPGSFGQIMALGLEASAQNTARGLSIFDARPGVHQPSLAVFSPDENGIVGFTWNGSNSNATVQTNDKTTGGNTNSFTLRSGNVTGGSGSSGDVLINTGSIAGGTGGTTGTLYLVTGNGVGTNSSSGNVTIDSGSKTGSGTNGALSVGTTNASAITIGRSGLTTTNGGGLSITEALAANGNVTLGNAAADLISFMGVIQGGTPLVFEGTTADGFETSFAITDPTAANVITFGDESGTVCMRNAANCGFSTGSGAAFVQGGNSFGATAVLGTNDAFALELETNGTSIATFSTIGAATFQNSTDSINAFRILDQAGTSTLLNADSTNGRVGIGGTASFSKFEVLGGDAAVYNNGGNPRLILGDSTAGGQNGFLQWDSTNDYFRIETVGTNGLKINDNFVSIGNLFPDQPLKVGNGSTLLAQVNTTGQALFQNSTNSTAAFRILNAAGTSTVFLADTTNNRIGVNTAAPDNALTVNGNLNVRDADTATKQYRFRTSGGDLDFDAAGAKLFFSVFDNGDLTGTQRVKLVMENGNEITQAIKIWQFRESANGTTRHLIDGSVGGQIVFNENSEATDFRVEGDADVNALFVQGSTSRVGVGTNAPAAKLHVSSTVAEPLFRVTDGTATAADVLNIADEGATTFKNRTDGNLAFEIQNAATSPIFRVDASARKVAIGAYSQTAADNITGQLQVTPTNDSRVGIQVKGFSPTWNANFYEGVDSVGNFMFRVQSTGVIITAGGVFSSNSQTAASTNSNFATLASGNVSGATSTSGTANVRSGDSTTSGNTGGVVITSGNATSGTSGNVLVDVGTASVATGTVFLGTTNASAVTVGNGTNTAISLNSGTGAINIGSGAQARTVNIATGAAAQALTIGSTNTTSATTIQAGTGNLTLSTNNSAASIIAKSSTDSTTAFRVLNSTNGDLMNVNTVDSLIDLLGNNTGHVGAFTADADTLPSARYGSGQTIVNGYIYNLGGCDSTDTRTTTSYYAKLNADGSIGSWGTTATIPNATCMPGTVTSFNGYIYVHGGGGFGDPDNAYLYYAKPNVDGTITEWKTANILMNDNDETTITAYNGYMYETNMNNPSIYYHKINADGSIGEGNCGCNWFSGSTHRSAGIVIANGYFYAIGGVAGPPYDTNVYYGKINADGSVTNPGTTTSPLPAVKAWLGAGVMNGYLYAIGGENDSTATNTVYYAKLNADGTLGAWQTDTTTLPANRSNFNALTYNSHIYAVGGYSGSAATNTAWYNTGSRVRIGGGLDLVGLTNGNAAEGGSGGALTAGNTNIMGTLNVSGNTMLRDGVSVLGDFSAKGFTSLLGSNTGHVDEFATESDTITARSGAHNSTIYLNGYMYVITGCSITNANTNSVQHTRLNADGTTGAWASTSATMPATSCDAMAATYNGYIYVAGGTSSAATSDDIYVGKPGNDGVVSSWTTISTQLPDDLRDGAMFAHNGYLYIAGGLDSTAAVVAHSNDVSRAKINADGTLGTFTTQSDWIPGNRASFAWAIANGYFYVIGGKATNTGAGQNTLYYGRFNADGSLATAVTNTAPGFAYRALGRTFVMNGYIYVLGGNTNSGSGYTDETRYAPLNADGSVGTWTVDTSYLPALRGGGGSLNVNGYVYYIGGNDATDERNTVYYTSGTRVKVGASLDLVGLGGETLAEGGSGGQLTAGNTIIAGTVNVSGNAVFNGGASVNNVLTVTTSNNTTGAFSVVNAAGTPILVADTTNSYVYIGNPTADATGALLVLDTKNTSGDPTGATGGMYYNSNSNKFRCYENGAWKNCLGFNASLSIYGGNGNGASAQWTNMPAALTEIFTPTDVPVASSRMQYDLTDAQQIRFQVSISTAGSASAEVRIQYSTDQATWNYLDSGNTGLGHNVSTTGLKVSSWSNIAAGAKGDVYLRVVGLNGDAVADPRFGIIQVQAR
ncbi:MAG TPA: hypothetical protein VJM32_00505 [Candidatus Saccharimonadales bacterium]|nr:hypothetical protein [Candidatus Saccharimonadales bacterium]